ncbi:hypothetical protein Agub_g3548, partial [Astrephomene gubernaculifera]
MRSLGATRRTQPRGRSSNPKRCVLYRRYVCTRYRTDEAAVVTPGTQHAACPLVTVEVLALSQLSRPGGPTGGEPLQTLPSIASTNHASQVLEAITQTARALLASGRDASSPVVSKTTNVQVVFQDGYDRLSSLLQALPQCHDAYSPAAAIPSTCVTLFHTHNTLIQAAHDSQQQDMDVWTDLMSAALGLYLLRAPRRLLALRPTGHLDQAVAALSRQDLWGLQRLLWERLGAGLTEWEDMQDLLSIVPACEQQARAAATAAAAAAATASVAAPAPGTYV